MPLIQKEKNTKMGWEGWRTEGEKGGKLGGDGLGGGRVSWRKD